jgi:guanylate kinase
LEEAVYFDYVVVNEDFETAVSEVRGILDAEGRRPERRSHLSGRVAEIQSEIESILGEGQFHN